MITIIRKSNGATSEITEQGYQNMRNARLIDFDNFKNGQYRLYEPKDVIKKEIPIPIPVEVKKEMDAVNTEVEPDIDEDTEDYSDPNAGL